MLAVTVPLARAALPRSVVTETKVRPAGRASVRVTPLARAGPLLVTVAVKTSSSPERGVPGELTRASARSDRAVAVTRRSCENSEVLPTTSVAVATRYWPDGTAAAMSLEKEASPVSSVVTTIGPR